MKHSLYTTTLVIALLLTFPVFGQQVDKVNWLTWEQAIAKQKVEKKKILVDVYTDWCSWCKRMDNTTFNNPEIAQFVNENYYPVKFNAEFQEEIKFRDKTYKFVKNGQRGYHELAAEMLKGRLSFPSVVFFNENVQVIQSMSGFKTPEQFELIITYFARDHYRKTPWSAYQRSYRPLSEATD